MQGDTVVVFLRIKNELGAYLIGSIEHVIGLQIHEDHIFGIWVLELKEGLLILWTTHPTKHGMGVWF